MTAVEPPSSPALEPTEPASDWEGHVSTVAQKDGEGWVTARPPKAKEILLRILGFPGLVRRHWDLLTTSCRRELEARFSDTVLGWLWPPFHPLFLFVVYYFIFANLLQVKIPNLPEDLKAAFGVWMFVGITVWAAIAETLNRGTNVIVDNGNLIKKLAFPSEILPLNLTIVGLITLAFAVTMFVLACFLTPMWRAPGIELLWVPVLLLVQGLFTYGLTLFLSTLQVFLRDTLQVVAVVTTVWMFATPIFWSPQVMPPSVTEFMPLLALNPVYHLVQAWRGALVGDLYVDPRKFDSETGEVVMTVNEAGERVPELLDITGGYVSEVAPIATHIGVVSIWALAFYVIGFAFFVLCQRRFADEV